MAATATITPAWTVEELAKANDFLSRPENKFDQGLQECFDFITPRLFNAYKIADALNDEGGSKFFESTLFETDPALGIYYIKEHLNSLRDRADKTSSDSIDYAPFYYPIIVEVEVDASAGSDAERWKTVIELTGREVFADGSICLPTIRILPENVRNWEWSGSPFGSNLVARKIRFSCVIYGDTRLNATIFQPGFGSFVGGNSARGYSTNPDAASFQVGYTRAELIDSRSYAYWQRSAKSKPIPASSPGVSSSGDYVAQTFGGAVLRNDKQRAFAHIEKVMWERGTLKKSGQMTYLGRMPVFDPGTTISSFGRTDGSFSIDANAVVEGVEYTSTSDESKAVVYLG